MKQVTYELDIVQLLAHVLDSLKPEDGKWKLEIVTESMSAQMPRVYMEQKPLTLPGHVVRVLGVKIIKAESPLLNEAIVETRDGVVLSQPIQGELFNDPDRDQNGSEQSS